MVTPTLQRALIVFERRGRIRFEALLASLGLPRQRFHDLRYAAATYMLAQGVDLRVVKEVLGHSQIHTTANTYAHARIETTRVAAERVEALLSR